MFERNQACGGRQQSGGNPLRGSDPPQTPAAERKRLPAGFLWTQRARRDLPWKGAAEDGAVRWRRAEGRIPLLHPFVGAVFGRLFHDRPQDQIVRGGTRTGSVPESVWTVCVLNSSCNWAKFIIFESRSPITS